MWNELVPVPPSAPAVGVTSTGTSWVHLQWSVVDTGGSAVRGFVVNYRQQEQGEWEEQPVPRDTTSYRLNGLICGIDYHVQVSVSIIIIFPLPYLVCWITTLSGHSSILAGSSQFRYTELDTLKLILSPVGGSFLAIHQVNCNFIVHLQGRLERTFR